MGVAHAGSPAKAMLDLSGPELDFVDLATGLGVPASRATTAHELVGQLERSLAEPGPWRLIEWSCPHSELSPRRQRPPCG